MSRDKTEPHQHGEPEPLRVCPDCGHDLQNCCDALWPEHVPTCPNFQRKKHRRYDICPWCHQQLPSSWFG